MAEVDITGDGGVVKKLLAEGSGDCPAVGDEVEAHYTGTLAETGAEFDSSRKRGKTFKFTLGQGQVIKGWDVGFATMKRGEKAVLTIRSDYGYGDAGSPPNIPPKATLNFDVELVGFGPKEKEKWEMNADEKMAKAEEIKTKANELFRDKKFAEATAKYEDALDYLDGAALGESDAVKKAKIEEAERTLLLNATLSCTNAREFGKAVQHASKALKSDKDNVKALTRRAAAYLGFGSLAEAKADLKRAIELDPKNPQALAEVARLHKLAEEAAAKEKAAFGGLFAQKKADLYPDKAKQLPVAFDKHKDCARAWMDIKIGDQPAKRVEFELWRDTVPKTVENFLALCSGSKSTPEKKLHFKGSTFHRIIKGFMAQGGDFTRGDGTGGESIYGEKFKDENFLSKHEAPYLLSMANAGPNTNGSQFFITFKPTPHLDGKHVVFGRVISGTDVVDEMEKVQTGASDKPVADVVVEDCGVLESAASASAPAAGA